MAVAPELTAEEVDSAITLAIQALEGINPPLSTYNPPTPISAGGENPSLSSYKPPPAPISADMLTAALASWAELEKEIATAIAFSLDPADPTICLISPYPDNPMMKWPSPPHSPPPVAYAYYCTVCGKAAQPMGLHDHYEIEHQHHYLNGKACKTCVNLILPEDRASHALECPDMFRSM